MEDWLEAYYFSKQRLSDGATGKSYWITGFMAEKSTENFLCISILKILLIQGKQI
jgi:hypothetical protein